MAIVDSWTLFQVGHVAKPSDVLSIMSLLGQTSTILAGQMATMVPTVLLNKINKARLGAPGSQPLPTPAPYAGGYNWMKASVGYDSSSTAIVAILYHLQRHRLYANNLGYWSVTVGFEQSLLPDVNTAILPTDSTHPYVPLAQEIAIQVMNDLSVMTPVSQSADGKTLYGVIYDNPDPSELPTDPPGKNEANRRRSIIGEFGLVVQKNPLLAPIFKTHSVKKVSAPKDKNGAKISGWADPVVESILEGPTPT